MRVLSSSRALMLAVAVVAASVLTPVAAYPLDVDIGLFYNDLSPYGTWYDSPQYGWVFAPRVSSGWRPYTVGHWVWTDPYGWMWVSEEDFGWATFHYGRWYQEPGFGWAWVPGTQWGPSWVSYRYSNDYIGWAPLPPNVGWSGAGLQIGGGGIDALIQPSYYTFVPARSFVNTGIHRYAVPVSRNTTIINVTRNVTSYSGGSGRVVNRSITVDQVEKIAGQRVRRARPVEVSSVQGARKARVKDDEIQVFKPTVHAAKGKAPSGGKPLPSKAAARPEPREREADERATVQGRADEAKRQADIDKKREADQRAAAQKRADEAKRQADIDKKREADQRAAVQRREAEAQAEQQRQAEARRQLERENQDRQRKEAEAKQRARQQEPPKAGVSREQPSPQPSKKPATKKKEKPKKPEEEKPPSKES